MNVNNKEKRNDYVATGIVVNRDRTKILMVFHRKLQKWLPPGGHLNEGELPHKGAEREVFEETGVCAVTIEVDDSRQIDLEGGTESQIPNPFCVLHELIPANEKDEEHMHIDFIFTLEADETETSAQVSEIENAQWFTRDQVLECDTFESVRKICIEIMCKQYKSYEFVLG